MSDEKVILTVSGLKQGRKRKVDPDHAVAILDLTRRQYTVNVRGDRGVASVGFSRKGDTLTVTKHCTTTPDWMSNLLTLLQRFTPESVHVMIKGDET